MISILIAGFIGGALRGIVGYVKYFTRYKEVEFKFWYFTGMMVLSGVIGFLAAWVAKDLKITVLGLESLTPAIAFVIGYAGGDFIENLFKIIFGKNIVFGLKK
ncbi:MAG: hypothetical protein U9R00_02445 [Patescibacteria group bacterium]|nr:hypothetical protein [Patescibacteria group bacterium]